MWSPPSFRGLSCLVPHSPRPGTCCKSCLSADPVVIPTPWRLTCEQALLPHSLPLLDWHTRFSQDGFLWFCFVFFFFLHKFAAASFETTSPEATQSEREQEKKKRKGGPTHKGRTSYLSINRALQQLGLGSGLALLCQPHRLLLGQSPGGMHAG